MSDTPPTKRQRVAGPEPSFYEQQPLEHRVGITEFLSPNVKGFSGILKQRYSDFLVNEIEPNGNVVHLTDMAIPKPKVVEPEPVVAAPEPEAAEENHDPTTIKDSDKALLLEAMDAEILDKVIERYGQLVSKAVTPDKTVKFQSRPLEDKTARSTFHQNVRRIFQGKFESSTTGPSGIIELNDTIGEGERRRAANTRRNGDGTPRGKYLHFTLYKENKDTMEVLNNLGRIIKLPPKAKGKTFGFAGTKDRRAITAQRVSALNINAERLAGLNKGKANAFKFGNFEYKDTGLGLGDLKGNEFAITLRNITVDGNKNVDIEVLRDIVANSAASFQETGFINYFGLQRFGTFATGTHDVGRKLLQQDWFGAVKEIMDYDKSMLEENPDVKVGRDDRDRARAIELFFSGDKGKFQEAYEKMPRRFSAEGIIIRKAIEIGLNPADGTTGSWLGTLTPIPHNLRTMYLHAYQSYIWNHAASQRAKLYPANAVVEGDLVLYTESEEVLEEFDQDGDPIVVDQSNVKKQFARARPLSKEEAESGKWTVEDIVLPMPGYDVEYPKNEVYQTYESLMKLDGLDPHDMKRSQREMSLSGSYRHVIGKTLAPVEWDVKRLKHLEKAVKTDLELIAEKSGGNPTEASLAEAASTEAEPSVDAMEEDTELAVVFKLQLGTSQYATMALRELMKEGGVQAFQTEFGRAAQ
ncbi:tRNA pseudouridine synthase D [Ascobolus immersus RN42]|uniref:tRNA pseudouridine synthase D n=1 Tax=Ascobolus immersus RN42 TaxID=1160509 RepID=A0A3N4IJS7_ASCIM|nr:tRNA pseudouridine synthase D [Ascobolus immersus RN42]